MLNYIVAAHKLLTHTLETDEAFTPSTSGLQATIHHISTSLEVTGHKQPWIQHTRDWHIKDDVGQKSKANSVIERWSQVQARLMVLFLMSPFSWAVLILHHLNNVLLCRKESKSTQFYDYIISILLIQCSWATASRRRRWIRRIWWNVDHPRACARGQLISQVPEGPRCIQLVTIWNVCRRVELSNEVPERYYIDLWMLYSVL